jgi:hypothetical protein
MAVLFQKLNPKKVVAIGNSSFDVWVNAKPFGWTLSATGLIPTQETSDVYSGAGALKLNGNGASSNSIATYPVNALIKANTKYLVRFRAKKSSGFAAGNVSVDLFGTGVNTADVSVAAGTLTTSYVEYSGTLTTGLGSIPSDLKLRVFIDTNPTAAQYVLVDDIVVVEDNANSGALNYEKYLWGKPEKITRISEPQLFNFSLIPTDGSFVKPTRGSYVVFNNTTFGNWFTGYITNDPELKYLGTKAPNMTPVWGYEYEATSDELVLNLQTLGIMPPFVNTTQGQILKALINRIAPGLFDTANIRDGQPIARFTVDPKAKFLDVVQEFTEQSAYVFYSTDGKLYFQPQDTPSALIIDGTSKHFTPSRLDMRPSQEPIVNDVLVIGDLEPQGYITEYFIGDGFTANFPLLSSVYGVDRAVLLEDDFSGSQIDQNKWSVYDTINNWLKVNDGYLNCTGGSNDNSYDVYITSANLLPLEGNLRLTHGEFDFVSASSGVIAGMWTGAPNSTYSGCIYGVECTKSGSDTIIKPIVMGVVDGTKTLTINTAKRYILRTIVNLGRINRKPRSYSALDSTGVVNTYTREVPTDYISFNTTIVEVDPSDGSIDATTSWSNLNQSLTASQIFAYYVPLASNDLHCTVANITLSQPMQVTLDIKEKGSSTWTPQLVGANDIDAMDGNSPVATVVTDNTGAVERSSALGTPSYNPGNAALVFFKDSTKQVASTPAEGAWIRVRYRRAGAAIGYVRDEDSVATEKALWGDTGIRSLTVNDLDPNPRTSQECEDAAAAFITGGVFQHYEGSYTQFHGYEITTEPRPGGVIKFQNIPSPFPTIPAEEIHEVTTTMDSKQPNEVFIHNVSFGRPDKLKRILARFREPENVTAPHDTGELPDYVDIGALGSTEVGDVIAPTLETVSSTQLNFNTNQVAPGLVPNLLINTEAFDDAYWTKSQLTTTATNISSPTGTTNAERFTPTGGATNSIIRRTVTGLSPAGKTYTLSVWLKAASGTPSISIHLSNQSDVARGTTVCSLTTSWKRFSVTAAMLTGDTEVRCYIGGYSTWVEAEGAVDVWGGQLVLGSDALAYRAVTTAPTYEGGFEIRYSDDSWGADDARNLVTRTSGQTFSVPRTARGRIAFLRAYNQTNKLLHNRDLTKAEWVKGSAATATLVTEVGPEGKLVQVSTLAFADATANSVAYQQTTIPFALVKIAYSAWVKGTAGQSFQLGLQDSSSGTQHAVTTHTFNGEWERVTLTYTGLSTIAGFIRARFFNNGSAVTFKITDVQLQVDTLTVGSPCKTAAIAYGNYSRYATGLRVQFPFIPTAPTATIDYDDAANPELTFVLPAIQQDVWGVEARKSNGTRIQSSGGGSIIKYYYSAGTSVNAVNYRWKVTVKNIGSNTVRVDTNTLGTSPAAFVDIPAGSQTDVEITGTGNGSAALQLKFQALSAGNSLDFVAWNPSIVRLDTEAELIPAGNQNFTGWTAFSGASITLTQAQEGETFYTSDLIDAEFNPVCTYPGNNTRSFSAFLYTYNLLDEYSTVYNFTTTIPTPSISNLRVEDETKTLQWTGANADKYKLEVDDTSSSFASLIFDVNDVIHPFLDLADVTFFPQRWFRVTPFDEIGAGTPSTTNHVYTPVAPVSFDSDEIGVLSPPNNPFEDFAIPSGGDDWRFELRKHAVDHWIYNMLLLP